MHKIDLKMEIKQRGMTLSELAMAMHVNPATVTRWCQRRVPAEDVLVIERLTGIPRHDLRPDIYPLED